MTRAANRKMQTIHGYMESIRIKLVANSAVHDCMYDGALAAYLWKISSISLLYTHSMCNLIDKQKRVLWIDAHLL